MNLNLRVMLKKETLEKIEKDLKLEDGSLSSAIENEEEVDVEIPELVIKTKEDHESFVKNTADDAKIAGVEMAVKDARTKLGLDFEGKTIDNLLDAHGKKTLTDAKDELGEPDTKIAELKKDNDLLRGNLTKKDEEIVSLKSNMETTQTQLEIDQKLNSVIPDNLNISNGDALILFKNKHDVSLGDNKELVIRKDGEVLKNSENANPLSAKEVMTDFATPFVTKPGGGGGGDDEPGGGGGTDALGAFTKEMKEKGHDEGSQAFNMEMQKRIANGTLKI
jgi:hypothetical protein